MDKRALSQELADQMKQFERLGGFVEKMKAKRPPKRRTVYTGTNKKNVQELRGWDAVAAVGGSSAGYGYAGWFAEEKREFVSE